MTDITKRQEEALSAVARLTELYGYPPTVDELAREMGVTGNAAYEQLLALRRAGRVAWAANKARTLRVL